MRKNAILAVIAGLIIGFANSQALADQEVVSQETTTVTTTEWWPFQIGFWPGAPGYVKHSTVRGWKLGVPISSGEGSVLGLESSIGASLTNHVEGLQVGIFANVVERGTGAQAGLVNVAKNYEGAQFGLVNVANNTNSGSWFEGVQFGLINHANDMDGMQFGLLNFVKKGRFSFMPLINFNFKDE